VGSRRALARDATGPAGERLPTLAGVTHLLLSYGLLLLFVAVAVESAGIPVPGETALVAAAVLAKLGHYSLWSVIVVAAAGAILGDNVGYWLGRVGGRKLLDRWEPIARHTRKVLPPAERFFERHGAKAVFFGRFIAILRVTAAWMAGISHMTWWRFFCWNAAGGIAWAALVAGIAWVFGKAVADAINHYGLYAVLGLIVVGAAALVALRFWQRRLLET
jgi:membrane protein DedA with SNARE-associated domain